MEFSIAYPPELPVSRMRDEIADAIRDNQVVIVAGATGSGKTTQLPKICLELGRESIGHTQPRRCVSLRQARARARAGRQERRRRAQDRARDAGARQLALSLRTLRVATSALPFITARPFPSTSPFRTAPSLSHLALYINSTPP